MTVSIPPPLVTQLSTTEFHSDINGRTRRGTRTETLFDPATGRPWGSVSHDADLVGEAVAGARASHTGGEWRSLTHLQRADVLDAIGRGIDARVEEIAALESLANGKPLAATKAEVAVSARWWQYYAALLRTTREDRIAISATKEATLRREPVGIVALITPFNGAFSLGTWKLAPALAAGNTVIIKPPLNSPGSTIMLKRIVTEAGVPDGALTIVQGGVDVGQRLVEHASVDMVSFTGSTGAAMQVGMSVTGHLGRFVAEAGGKSAHIIFDDARLDDAVTAVVQGGFSATGQTCVAGSRVLVQRGAAEEFTAALLRRVSRLRVGAPTEDGTHLGPVASAQQLQRIQSLISQAIADGATVLAGGAEPPRMAAGLEGGYWVAPTVLRVADNSADICQTEVFGPVLTLTEFTTEEEAVAMANDSAFGLAAGCWTSDMARARRMSQSLDAGTVWINTYRGMDWQTPFGGVKQSGIGRENGIEGLREFQEVKAVVQDFAAAADPFGLA
ncbi:aldehyde dehydrogenase family protein [Saccharopolyspora sp. ASAGF58]|uniref:aldehyde dehydrogenase family protein n=1 Tax=Saccharopolyspora sp. ASAGF58 TaxID=2719023 RepID=UPI001440308B|nr:aldehyde dehydrogenase family protein [Saccharopolyspora sp. ASAGF58]QIZ38614.1 aldehyde dehydrogenase family protein [Saccharopolyspora sp. ASAGF58]